MADGLTESADLILEDGTGLVDANAFAGIAAADAYANLRQTGPFANWAIANESNHVAALIIATAYVEWRWSFAGAIFQDDTDAPQALHFPVVALLDKDGRDVSEMVPQTIEDATIEYAARSISPADFTAQLLQFDLDTQDTAGRSITLLRQKVGPLETETRYSGSGRKGFANYGYADQLIKASGLLAGTGSGAIK